MLTLAFPWVLALLPLPWLVRRFLPAYKEPRRAVLVPRLDRVAAAAGAGPSEGAPLRRTPAAEASLAAVWVLLVLAAARPQRIEPPVTRTVPVRDLLLAVDLSGSMETKDFTDRTGAKSDRLAAVRQVLDDFLARRDGDRVGLIFFGSAAFVQAPFTEDLASCRELLAEARVGMAGPKTAIGDAVGLGVRLFDGAASPEKVMILLTDGNDTAGGVPPVEAARVAKDKGVTVHAVAVGDPKAAGEDALDEETLRSVARTTGGTYAHAADRAALEKVYDELDRLEAKKAETVGHRPRVEMFAWPLGAALVLSLVFHAASLRGGR